MEFGVRNFGLPREAQAYLGDRGKPLGVVDTRRLPPLKLGKWNYLVPTDRFAEKLNSLECGGSDAAFDIDSHFRSIEKWHRSKAASLPPRSKFAYFAKST